MDQDREAQILLSRKIEEEAKGALKKVGDQHRYQIGVMIYFSISLLLVMYQLVAPSYYFMNPIFECNGHTTPEEEACQKLEECVLVNDYTITSSNQLYCGDKIKQRNLIQSMLGYGALIGLIVINFLSDYKGRKFSLLLAVTIMITSMIVLIVGAAADKVWVLCIAQILGGFSTIGLLSISYVLSDKLMSKKMLKISVLTSNGFSALAEVSLIFFTTTLNWKDMAIYMVLIPSVFLFLIGFWLLVDDPAFLFTRHLYEESYASLKKVAKINNKEEHLQEAISVMKTMERKGLEIPSEQSKSFKESFKYLKVLFSREIIIPLIGLGLNSFGGNILYYSLNFAASDTGNSYSTNMILFGLAEFTGVLPLMYLGSKFPLKKSLYFIAVLSIGLCLTFFIDLEPVVQSTIIFFIRFIQCQQYALYVFLQVQSFPQHIQGTAMGLVEVIGQPAKTLSPYVVEIANENSISPIGIMSIVILLFMILPILPLKEPHRKKKHEKQSSENDQLTESLISSKDNEQTSKAAPQ